MLSSWDYTLPSVHAHGVRTKRHGTKGQNHTNIHEPSFTVSCKFLLIFVSLIYDFIYVGLSILYECFHKFNEGFNRVTSKDRT